MKDKMEILADIMFEEDLYRYENNKELLYFTEEDFLAEKKEREENKKWIERKSWKALFCPVS